MRRFALILLAGVVGLGWHTCVHAAAPEGTEHVAGPDEHVAGPDEHVSGPDEPVPADDDPAKRCYLSGEYMLFWVKRANLSTPLITTGTGPNAGGLQDPNTTSLFNGNQLNFNPSSGLRGEYDFILCPGITLTAGGFFVGEGQRSFQTASDQAGNPILVRPFFDAENLPNAANAASVLSFPGALAGGIRINTNRNLFGLEFNSIIGLYGDEGPYYLNGRPISWQLSGSLGVRYLNLNEDLQIRDFSTALVGPPLAAPVAIFNNQGLFPGDQIFSLDRFATRNQFVGGQGGLTLEGKCDRFWLGVTGKLALGETHQSIVVEGASTLLSGTFGTQTLPVGTLALMSNSGHFSRDKFAAVPEIDLKFAVEITPTLRAVAGYDYLYWSNVVRATEIVPGSVSSFQQATSPFFGQPARQVPAPIFPTSSLWLQAVHVGLEWRF